VLIEPEPMLPTRGYRVLCHDTTLIDPGGRGDVADGNAARLTVTTLVIGLPRQMVVQRCKRADVDVVLRDERAVWPPLAVR
jgi:hypothetical protein